MRNVEQTIISQFANSPAITKMIQNMNAYIDPRADIDNFYWFVWNVDTAQGFGLDIWGRIVDVSRELLQNTAVANDDDAFRELIMLKALSNISESTSPAINQLLTNWMSGRGRCYVTDRGNMEMVYVFEFLLQPFEIAIIQQSGIFLRPAGVGGIIITSQFPVFGFSEAGTFTATPFGQAPFIAEDAINAIS